jgi:hypothetical protein
MAGKIIHKSPMKGRQVVNAHNLRKTFMIFTEGQTEEGYFKKFLAHIWQSKKGSSVRAASRSLCFMPFWFVWVHVSL